MAQHGVVELEKAELHALLLLCAAFGLWHLRASLGTGLLKVGKYLCGAVDNALRHARQARHVYAEGVFRTAALQLAQKHHAAVNLAHRHVPVFDARKGVGQDAKAERILARINGAEEAKKILDDIKNTVTEKKEKLLTYGVLCIFVGVMLSVFQQAVGINAVLYYAPRIYDAMGFDNPMVLTVFNGIVNLGFTCVAIFTVEKLGRKPLLISGSLGMALGAIGVAITFGNPHLQLLCMVSIMVYSASFMFSWGPICWVLIAEVFPNTIRGAAVAIAVAFQWIFNWIVSTSFVPMANSLGYWFTYGLYGVICILAALFVWKLVPETKGKTLEDMTKLWKKD